MLTQPEDQVSTSFNMPANLHKRWAERFPRYGDRSLCLREMVQQFLDGKIEIKIERQL